LLYLGRFLLVQPSRLFLVSPCLGGGQISLQFVDFKAQSFIQIDCHVERRVRPPGKRRNQVEGLRVKFLSQNSLLLEWRIPPTVLARGTRITALSLYHVTVTDSVVEVPAASSRIVIVAVSDAVPVTS